MSKLCINEVIPYVQKYDWGNGETGIVYTIMKNVIKENAQVIRKDLEHVNHLREYMDPESLTEVKGLYHIKQRKLRDADPNKIESKNSRMVLEEEKKDQTYAEIWMGSHEKSPNFVVYNKSLVHIEEFLQIYINKRREKKKLIKTVIEKLKTAKDAYLKKKNESRLSFGNLDIENEMVSKDLMTRVLELMRRAEIRKREQEGICELNEVERINTASLDMKDEWDEIEKEVAKELNEDEGVMGEEEEGCGVELDVENKNFNAHTHLLPYLCKVLSIAKPLSIQIHPNQKQTIQLNIQNPNIYKDTLFKSEMCVCINDMSLFCGLMNIFKISFIITQVPELFDFFKRSSWSGPVENMNGEKKNEDRDETIEDKERGSSKEESKNNISVGEEEFFSYGSEGPLEDLTGEDEPEDCDEDENQTYINLFFKYRFGTKDGKRHVKEILLTFSRIYMYIIDFVLHTASESCDDLVEVIDGYAEAIQKYVHDTDFFYAFVGNDNFLDNDICLLSLLSEERHKVKKTYNFLKEQRKNANENFTPFSMDKEAENDIESKEPNESKSEFELSDYELNDDKFNVAMKILDDYEKEKFGYSEGRNLEGHMTDRLCKVSAEDMERIQSSYDHLYKYLIQSIVFTDKKTVNKYLNNIILYNEQYATFSICGDFIHKKIKQVQEEFGIKSDTNYMFEELKKYILNSSFSLLQGLTQVFRNDPGRIYVFLLKHLTLKKGNVLYIRPGVVHSYISGECIECMTKSDLVIRGGLTNKHKDCENFVKCIKYRNNKAIFLPGDSLNYNITKYEYPSLKYFKLFLIKVNPGESVSHEFSEFSFTTCIILSSNKKVKLLGTKRNNRKRLICDVKKDMIFLVAPKTCLSVYNMYAHPTDGSMEFIMYCACS